MPRNTYSKKINEWDLDIEYNYVPAEPATHDYPGTGSTIEVHAIYLWNEDINVSTDEQVDMADFFYEIEKEITEDHENS